MLKRHTLQGAPHPAGLEISTICLFKKYLECIVYCVRHPVSRNEVSLGENTLVRILTPGSFESFVIVYPLKMSILATLTNLTVSHEAHVARRNARATSQDHYYEITQCLDLSTEAQTVFETFGRFFRCSVSLDVVDFPPHWLLQNHGSVAPTSRTRFRTVNRCLRQFQDPAITEPPDELNEKFTAVGGRPHGGRPCTLRRAAVDYQCSRLREGRSNLRGPSACSL
ncbi:hypothetical protein CHS0354_043010 [Potamilus streckersoni]|uniref:Uncharacterized protein n=1 Tax=Potamilus streckersoni TaxID=2493646 RepID=A0AAE0T3L0_9BIVA|nr:hypothetical protein CHS0354_043010 [Potamilus streckersoni]